MGVQNLYFADSWQTNFFSHFQAKKILCKVNDAKKAKKNITLKSPFLGHFGSKFPFLEKNSMLFTFSKKISFN